MKRTTKAEITAETINAVVAEQRPTTMTQLAHGLGYKGNVSGSLAKKIRALCPDIGDLLAKAAESAKGPDRGKSNPKPEKPAGSHATKPPKSKKGGKPGQPKPVTAQAESNYPRDSRNPFRASSAYGVCFDILAAHKDGLLRKELVGLLAKETGKDEKHAGYDAQVLLSAKPNENGLNNNDSPRHRACRPGFYIKREGDNVRLAVD